MMFVFALDMIAPRFSWQFAMIAQEKVPMIILLLVILFVLAGIVVNSYIFKKNKPAEPPAEETSGEENEQ